MFDAILFDFDGTVADTEGVHFHAWREVLAPLGIGLDWDAYEANCIGVSDIMMLGFIASMAATPIEAAAMRPVYERKREVFRRRVAESDVCAAETIALIVEVAACYPLAVVTSSCRPEVEPVLERYGILPHLSASVYGDDVARHKPAPDPYLRAAQLLRVSRPLVVEDSVAGVASATAAGFEVIRVATPADTAPCVRARLTACLTA